MRRFIERASAWIQDSSPPAVPAATPDRERAARRAGNRIETDQLYTRRSWERVLFPFADCGWPLLCGAATVYAAGTVSMVVSLTRSPWWQVTPHVLLIVFACVQLRRFLIAAALKRREAKSAER